LTAGTYTAPTNGYYHVFATIAVNYTPANGATSYAGNLSTNPMYAVFVSTAGSPFLITACFFSNSYAGVGGPSNSTGIDTYDTATIAGDLFLTAGTSYEIRVYNPFVDATVVTLLGNGTLPATGVYCRWSIDQFA
jgi:hypothetical protein